MRAFSRHLHSAHLPLPPGRRRPLHPRERAVAAGSAYGPRPAPATPIKLGIDDSYTTEREFAATGLAYVLDQDTDNFRRQRAGMKALLETGQTLGNYQEARIRRLHMAARRLPRPPHRTTTGAHVQRLAGKRVVIHGFSRGLGGAFAIACAAGGARVVVDGTNADTLADVEHTIRETGADVLAVRGSVATKRRAKRSSAVVPHASGGIDAIRQLHRNRARHERSSR